MTTLTDLTTASEHDFYIRKQVKEIQHLRDKYKGIIAGYIPTICDNENIQPTEAGLRHVIECRDNLEMYPDIFEDELRDINGLISKIEAILNEQTQGIKGGKEK